MKRWKELREKKLSAAEQKSVDDWVERELLEMNLRALRESLGKTQAEVAAATEMTQSELSRLEQRRDHLVSSLRRVVEGLGGQLRVTAVFGDKEVELDGV